MKERANEQPKTEAQTFTDFTRRLLAVPKKEIDAEKAKYEKQKEHKNGKRAK